jgi:hypothetical protein
MFRSLPVVCIGHFLWYVTLSQYILRLSVIWAVQWQQQQAGALLQRDGGAICGPQARGWRVDL